MCDSCGREANGSEIGERPAAGAVWRVYNVEGMTCAHCKASVTEEVSLIAGVGEIEVDVAAGTLSVTGDVSGAQIEAAVEEAGYRVVS